MKRSARTFGFTIAASLGLHGVVLLAAAWLMAVLPEHAKKRPASLLISHTDLWHYRKGTSAPGPDWKSIADESLDATWLEGRGWFGYGHGTPRTPLPDMRRGSTSPDSPGYRMLYLRKTFTVSSSLPATDEVVLDIDFDDGFIAWIDGNYVDHEGPPGDPPAEPAWNEAPDVFTHECSFGLEAADPQPVRSKVLGTIGKMLPPGTHILSVLLINDSVDSNDAALEIELRTRKPPPENAAEKEAAPSLEDVTVTFVPAEAMAIHKPPPPPSPPQPLPGADDRGRRMVYSDGSQPLADPLNRETALASNQKMRAASTSAPTPGADPNRVSQDGADIPVLSLNSRDFSPGGTPAEPPTPPEVVETRPALPADPPEEERRPDPKNAVKTDDPLAPAPAKEKDKDIPAIQPPLRDRPPEPLPLAKSPSPSIRKIPDPVSPGVKSPSPAKSSAGSVKTKSAGGVTLRAGESSEDAIDTPWGRYNGIIRERVGAIWNAKLAGVHGLAGAGVVEVEYYIDAKGAVSGVKLVDPGKANAVLEDVCLTAIIKVKLPPPPEEMLRELRDPLSSGKVRRTLTFYRL